jgi:RNA ligase (TIGR02306 family)
LGPYEYTIGEDVSEALRITKYEPPPRFGFNSGQAAGPFPSFVPKTDELRLQSILPVLEEIKGVPLYWTVKCDGTSSTFAKLDGEFYVCSRNLRKKSGDNVYWKMVEKYKLEEYIPDGLAVQGEICGPGIQKNRLKLEEPDLFVFDVFDIKAGRYVGFDKFMSFCGGHLKTVPVEEVVPSVENARGAELTTDNIDLSLEAWLERAKGLYEGTDNRREGIVVRSLTPTFSREVGGRLSFKVLNNDFLLKDEN